jgi:hypothetical protein
MGMWRREKDLKGLPARLRAERAEPSRTLIEKIVHEVGGARVHPRRRPRLALGAALTAALLVALAAVGGVGYAASSVTHAVNAVVRIIDSDPGVTDSAGSNAPDQANRSAAGDQYQPPPAPPPGPFVPPNTVLTTAASLGRQALNQLLANCNTRPTPAARAACRRAMQALFNRLNTLIDQNRNRVDRVPPANQADLQRLLGAYQQQLALLRTGQAARRNAANCNVAANRNTPQCRNLARRDASELLRLLTLQQMELDGFLDAAVGPT